MQTCNDLESKLHFDLLKDINESNVIDFYHDFLIKSQDKLQDINLERKSLFHSSGRQDPLDSLIFRSHSKLFRHFIVLFNCFMTTIQESITSFDLQCMAYPAREFCDLDLANGVKIDWNSDNVFSDIRFRFSKVEL
jgi:hypothetical protein